MRRSMRALRSRLQRVCGAGVLPGRGRCRALGGACRTRDTGRGLVCAHFGNRASLLSALRWKGMGPTGAGKMRCIAALSCSHTLCPRCLHNTIAHNGHGLAANARGDISYLGCTERALTKRGNINLKSRRFQSARGASSFHLRKLS